MTIAHATHHVLLFSYSDSAEDVRTEEIGDTEVRHAFRRITGSVVVVLRSGVAVLPLTNACYGIPPSFRSSTLGKKASQASKVVEVCKESR